MWRSLILLLGVFALGFALYFYVTTQSVSSEVVEEPILFATSSVKSTAASSTNEDKNINELIAPIKPDAGPSLSETVPEAGITVDLSILSAEQKAVAQSFGFEGDSATISPTLTACVEEAFGPERLQAILLGDTPTVLEGIRALSCLNQVSE